jgi:hypothetical protein
VAALTVATQIGGAAVWPALGIVPLVSLRRRAVVALVLGAGAYAVASAAVVPALARARGHAPLPCLSAGPLRPRSLLFCVANRHYVVAKLHDEAAEIARAVEGAHPGSVVRFLDAGFPLFDGFPLVPHLSHRDGRQLDLALFLEDAGARPIDGGGSPIGYFGYVQPLAGVAPACPPRTLDLRWDLTALQPWFGPPQLDMRRTASLVRITAGRAAVEKILLEPHLRARLGIDSAKVRFQGCDAARHDDHIHLQIGDAPMATR